MKILQINNYHYLKGGSERVYFETSRLLEDRGHKVIHFSVNDNKAIESPYEKYFIEPVHYFAYGHLLNKIKSVISFLYSREAKRKLELLLQREKPDVAHLHIFYGRLTSAILPVLKEYNVPIVMTVHEYRMLCPVYLLVDNKGDICECCASGGYTNCVLKRCNKGRLSYSIVSALECYIRDLFFSYVKYVDRFIMVSAFIRDKHIEYISQLQNKTCHIYNFISLESISRAHNHRPYYLYAGRLSREKGMLTLLNAWRDFPSLKLKIAGDGPLDDVISRFLQENNMHNVEQLGHLSGQALFNVMKHSKFLIVPSEWYENNPMSILEAFAIGLPVIGSNMGGIPELIKEGINGFLFEATNEEAMTSVIKLAEGLTNDAYWKMSEMARTYAEENFSRDTHYEKLMGVYREVALK